MQAMDARKYEDAAKGFEAAHALAVKRIDAESPEAALALQNLALAELAALKREPAREHAEAAVTTSLGERVDRQASSQARNMQKLGSGQTRLVGRHSALF